MLLLPMWVYLKTPHGGLAFSSVSTGLRAAVGGLPVAFSYMVYPRPPLPPLALDGRDPHTQLDKHSALLALT